MWATGAFVCVCVRVCGGGGVVYSGVDVGSAAAAAAAAVGQAS